MFEVLTPLGPDGGGTWDGTAGRCGVAVAAALRRRTPSDAADRQPAVSGDGSAVVVADIRLDNRADLCAALGDLGGLGTGLGSNTRPGGREALPDSCLVLAAYRKWGLGVVDRLVGVYAFAVVDRRRGGVLVVRDHLGLRPLVVHQRPGLMAFASNALALTALEGVGHRIDERRAAEILSLTYASDRTFVEGVRWLPPGHALWADSSGTRRWRWWRPDPARVVDLGSAGAEALRGALDDAVSAQLPTRGRLGSHVSGGLDSPSVTATAALAVAPGELATYTSVPPPGWTGAARRGWDADESPLVRELAARYANLRPRFVYAGGEALVPSRFERYWELGAAPVRNPCNATWVDAIDAAASDHGVTTLLTASAGNLAFSADGPDWLWALARAGRLRRVAAETAAWSRHRGVARWDTLRVGLVSPAVPSWLRRLRQSAGQGPDPVGEFLAGTALRPGAVSVSDVVAGHPELDPSRWAPYRMALWAAASNAGGQADTAAALEAWWGVDHRDPTADRRLLELAFAQPEWARRHDGTGRAVAREAMAARLPASIVWRSRKGDQLPDWLDRMTDGRAELTAEIDAARDHPLSRRLIDTERLASLAAAWPARERSGDPNVIRDYRSVMLRALVVSRYLRWFDGRGRAQAAGRPGVQH
jgi:asparagine synthase (glutamine-hydrolysing)